MRTTKLVLILALFGLTVVSATPLRGTAQEGGSTADVLVQNQGSSGVHVYVVQVGRMVPVGFVKAMEAKTLTIPSIFIESGEAIHLVADPLASSDWYKSDPLAVRPTSKVTFTIEHSVDRSHVTVSG